MKIEFDLIAPGPRPPYDEVAHHLWGTQCDFDSDGDSYDPHSTQWTELTVTLRNQTGGWVAIDGIMQRVDIEPVSLEPLTLRIASEDRKLSNSTAQFLRASCGGTLKPASLEQKSNSDTRSTTPAR